MTEEPLRTPLTLEFKPDNIAQDASTGADLEGIVICEPSFEAPGRIFLGVNPVGQRVGVHMVPEETIVLRDHLTKLLLEPGADQSEQAGVPESVQSRIDRAVQRIKDKKRKLFVFRLEFEVGGVQGVIGRFND